MSVASAQSLTPPAFNSETALTSLSYNSLTPTAYTPNEQNVYTSGTLEAGTWAFFLYTNVTPTGGTCQGWSNYIEVSTAISPLNIQANAFYQTAVDGNLPLNCQGIVTSATSFTITAGCIVENEPPTANPTGFTLNEINVVGIKLA